MYWEKGILIFAFTLCLLTTATSKTVCEPYEIAIGTTSTTNGPSSHPVVSGVIYDHNCNVLDFTLSSTWWNGGWIQGSTMTTSLYINGPTAVTVGPNSYSECYSLQSAACSASRSRVRTIANVSWCCVSDEVLEEEEEEDNFWGSWPW